MTTANIAYRTITKKNYQKYKENVLEFYNHYFPDTENKIAISKSSAFFVAIKNKEVVGCCRLLTDFSRNATLYDLIVRKSNRNRGIGTKLTKMAISFCRKKSIQKLYLTTDPRYPWLKKFYTKLGFSVPTDQTLMKIRF